MNRFLLDTNAVAEPRKPTPNAAFVRWLAQVDESSLFLSVLTFGEIQKGIRLAPEAKRADLERWLSQLAGRFAGRIVPFDLPTARQWGKLDGEARSLGRVVPVVDGMLAATVLERDMTLVTRNRRDFAGLCEVVDPWNGAA